MAKRRFFVVMLCAIMCMAFVFCSCGKTKTYVSGDFVYYKVTSGYDAGRVRITDLSDIGKTKEIVIVPRQIDGYDVAPLSWYSNTGTVLKSEKLRYLYILPKVYIDYDMFGLFARGNPEYDDRARVPRYVPNIEKVIMIGKDSYINDRVGFCEQLKIYSQLTDRRDADETGCIYLNWDLANCVYHYNADGADNVYWIDNYEYGSVIGYVPPVPERQGYTFGGWYKEPECINMWNFKVDTLPQIMTNEENKALYQKTDLYAKWYQG